MQIERETGILTLDEFEFYGGLTAEDLDRCPALRPFPSSIPSLYWFGSLDGYQGIVSRSERRLTQVRFQRNGIEGYIAKAAHDSALRACLGPETKATVSRPKWGPFAPPKQDRPWIFAHPELRWVFPWGSVTSGYDAREWQPEISITWS